MESAPAARGRLPAWTPPVWAALQSKTNHPVSVTPHLSGNLRSQRVRLCFRHRAAAAGAQLWALLVRRRGRSGLAGARFHVRSVPEGLDGIFWKTEPRVEISAHMESRLSGRIQRRGNQAVGPNQTALVLVACWLPPAGF